MAEHDLAVAVQGVTLEVRPGRHLSVAHRPAPAGSDTTLFFAHGGGGNKDQWRYLWQDPRLAGYDLVAWDILGHGASDTPRTTRAYAWDELVADQLAIYRRFAGTRNVAIGHSFGTALTLSTLEHFEQRSTVAAVLLLGTQLHAPARGGLLHLPAWTLELLRPWLVRGFRQAAWHAQTDPALVDYEVRLTERNSLRVFKALVGQGRWIPENLDWLRAPVRILSGEADGITPLEGGRALHEKIPGSQFHVLPRTAHQLLLERPDAVLEHLLELLQQQHEHKPFLRLGI
ncbi:alpha/beta fold hydrolase [Pseudomonas sp. LRF_L74]|uniref:alpha/beta fold hydrolase n=1 Tax=Pseudomonas sp. LRF_L74 TaxID=3369422 RepID=UPI003F61FD79